MEDQLKNYNFLVADDHKIITQSLSFIIKDLYENAVVTQVNELASVLKTLNKEIFDLLILDITFPDGNTLQILPTLKSLYPKLKILMFSGNDEEVYALRYINAGANGFVSKLASEEDIENAIVKVLTQGKYYSAKIQEKIADRYLSNKPINPLDQLSDRELEIARMLVDGISNTEIASKLSLQKSTVSTYKNRVFEKLEISSISDLIQMFTLHS